MKKSKKKTILITLLIVAVISGIVAWLIVTKMIKPKDLGVKVSKDAYDSALSKLNYTKDDAPNTGNRDDYEYIYGEPKEVDVKLTSEELTSFFGYNRPSNYALKKVQIRVNKNDTIDFSGVVNTDYFIENVLDGKYSKEDILKAVPALKFLPEEINLYANLSGELVDNKSSDVEVSNVKVMGIKLPESLYNTTSAKEGLSDVIDNYLNNVTEKTKGTYDLVKIEDGELVLKGNLPSTLVRKKKG